MGIDVRLEDEDGNEEKSVLDPGFDLEKLLPSIEDETSYCLRFIDPYGDTVFNNLQIPKFIFELEKAIEKVDDEKAITIGKEILNLAKECSKDVHLYLKFYGD